MKKAWEAAEKESLEYIETKGQALIEEGEGYDISCDSVLNDPVLFELIKRTWVGSIISILSKLKNLLEEKQRNMTFDLTSLLQ